MLLPLLELPGSWFFRPKLFGDHIQSHPGELGPVATISQPYGSPDVRETVCKLLCLVMNLMFN